MPLVVTLTLQYLITHAEFIKQVNSMLFYQKQSCVRSIVETGKKLK